MTDNSAQHGVRAADMVEGYHSGWILCEKFVTMWKSGLTFNGTQITEELVGIRLVNYDNGNNYAVHNGLNMKECNVDSVPSISLFDTPWNLGKMTIQRHVCYLLYGKLRNNDLQFTHQQLRDKNVMAACMPDEILN